MGSPRGGTRAFVLCIHRQVLRVRRSPSPSSPMGMPAPPSANLACPPCTRAAYCPGGQSGSQVRRRAVYVRACVMLSGPVCGTAGAHATHIAASDCRTTWMLVGGR